MTLCYYVTGHGFGHAIRTCQVLKALPPDVPVLVKTTVPPRLFTEELPGREIKIVSGEYDCGALQSDSLTTLPAETLARYRVIAARNEAGLSAETAFLQEQGVSCVVSDIPSFPLRAARAAGIPGIAVCNFTWHDIYREYAQNAEDFAVLDAMAVEYAEATDALVTPLALSTVGDVFEQVTRVPLVARRGIGRRRELDEHLARPVGKHFALLYLGVWGMTLNWNRLAEWKDWVFLTETAPPRSVQNVVTLDKSAWRWADVAASVDAVIAKPGYGTLTECIANSVPLIYVPREGFAEQSALLDGMARWGGGVELAPALFESGDWRAALEGALTVRPDPHAFEIDGANIIASRLLEYI